MHPKLEKILRDTKRNNYELEKFSKDIHQISPEKRISSIINIISSIRIPKKSNIIDVGTGYGYGAILFNALGHNVIGIDIFDKKISEGINYWENQGIQAEKNFSFDTATSTNGKLYLENMDSRKINLFPNESVDLVTSFYLSTYMIGKNGAYQNVHKVLKPDGKLLISTEGPLKKYDLVNKKLVNLSGILFAPKGMKFESMLVLKKNEAHDRYLIMYRKDLSFSS